MFCSKCGTRIPDGAKFCPKCGMPVKDNNYEQQNKDVNQKNVRKKNDAKRRKNKERNIEKKLKSVPQRPKKLNSGLIILIVLLSILVIMSASATIWYLGGKDFVQAKLVKTSVENIRESEMESVQETTESMPTKNKVESEASKE